MLARVARWWAVRQRARRLERVRDYQAYYGHQVYDVPDEDIVRAAEELARSSHPDTMIERDREDLAELLARLARGR